MKRLLLSLSFLTLGGLSWGAGGFNGLTVSSGTYRSISTYGNNDGGDRQAIILGDRASSSTVTVDPLGWIQVQLATSSAAGIGSLTAGTAEIGNVKNSGTFAVQSAQSGAWSVSPGTGTYPTAVTNTVPVTGTFWQATQPISGTVTAAQPVDSTLNASVSIKGSSNTVQITGTPNVAVTNSPTIANTTFQASQPVDATLNASVSIKGTSNTVTSNDTLLVSSNTAVPTAVADAGNVRAMGDKYGRTVTLPIAPWGLVRVATATLTTTTVEQIFISSAASNTYNRIIGCIGENTSATAADITFRPTGPAANNVGSFKLGMSVSNVPVGFFPPSGIPQLTTGNWTIQGSVSVTSLHVTCWFVVE